MVENRNGTYSLLGDSETQIRNSSNHTGHVLLWTYFRNLYQNQGPGMSIPYLWQALWRNNFECPLPSLANYSRRIISKQSWPYPLTLSLHSLWRMESLSHVLLLTTWSCDGNISSWHQKYCDNSQIDIQSAQSPHYLISWNRVSHYSFIWQ